MIDYKTTTKDRLLAEFERLKNCLMIVVFLLKKNFSIFLNSLC